MSKKVLITGVAGFIGTNLYLRIQEQYPDWEIYGVDNFSTGIIQNLKQFKGSFHPYDIRDDQFILGLKDVELDYIFHLAANSSTTDYDPLSQTTTNVDGFRNVLTLGYRNKVPIIWTSSASVYGKRDNLLKESDDLAPDSPYAISKMLAENIQHNLAAYCPYWKLVGVRPLNVYGCYEDGKGKMASMVTQLLTQMLAGERPRVFIDGTQIRDFIYVMDLVDLLITAAETDTGENSMIFNGGTGQPTSFLEVIGAINHLLNSELTPEFIPNPHTHYQDYTCASLESVEEHLKWAPKYKMSEALEEMLAHHTVMLKKNL